MGKFFCLLWQKTRTLARSSPLVFCVIILVQTVTAFSYIFFFSTVVKSRAGYVAAYDEMRRISVKLQEPEKTDANVVKMLSDNGVAQPCQITFYFEQNGRKFAAYLYPEKENGDVTGKGITKEDLIKKSPLIIPANRDKGEKNYTGRYKIGDSINICGQKFCVRGVRHDGMLDEVPYTTGFDTFKLEKIDFLAPSGLTDREKEQLGRRCGTILHAIDVTLPKPLAQRVFTNLFYPFIASAFIGIIAILNFIFLYRYMLERCRRDYTLLRVCGCSRRMSLALLCCQLAAMFTVSYLVAIAVFVALKILGIGIFKTASIGLSGCAGIYFAFILVIVLMVLPFAFGFFKKSIIDGEKLLS